jgi:hypothetical protein
MYKKSSGIHDTRSYIKKKHIADDYCCFLLDGYSRTMSQEKYLAFKEPQVTEGTDIASNEQPVPKRNRNDDC